MRPLFRLPVAATVMLLAGGLAAQDRIDPRPVPVRPCAPCPPEARCIVPECPPNALCARPLPCPAPDIGAQRQSTHVRAVMDGRIVRYEIEDRYVNRGGRPAEVDYVLPLPKGAAFENLELSINGEMIAGETMRAERARAVYEEIVRKLRDPALVEWMGHDVLRTRIFPIQPGEEKRVVVRFSAVAQREGDAIRLDWPARAMANARTDDDWFELRYAPGAGNSLGEPYSPTHALSALARDRAARTLRATGATRAMTVLIPERRAAAATIAMLPYAPSGEDGYALITVTPPARAARTTSRDVTFVVDVSGSMSGQKIEQARAAGRQFLNSLGGNDRFRIIAFSSDVRDFRDGWSPVTRETIRAATEFFDDLRPSGGTNIDAAVAAALAAQVSGDRLPLVLLLTDGAPTVGETRPEAIATHVSDIRGRARLFTFGLGADVNAALLERVALQGRGTATFLRPEESVERAVGVVTERLTTPVAADVTVRLDDARLYAVQPQGQIDIFAGQDLVVLARYTGRPDWTTVSVEGRGPDGPVRWTQRVRLPERTADNAFVARLWAVQRIGWLSAERRRAGGNAEVDGELRQLGERYGIPTELTSYLVVEPGMRTAQFVPMSAPAAQDAAARAPRASIGQGGQQLSQVVVTGVATNAAPEVGRFEAAKLASDQRDVKSLGDERQAALNESDRLMKVAGGRAFRADKDGVWVEARAKKAARVVTVKAFSEAYFAILRELPEIASLLTVGEKVRVEGRAVAIEVTPLDSGLSSLDSQQLASLVRDWR